MERNNEPRDSRSSRGDPPRSSRGSPPAKSTKRKKKRGRGFRIGMTIVLILIITLSMLLCMASAYIKNVIIPNAELNIEDFQSNMNLTTTMYYRSDSEDGEVNYEVLQTLYSDENRIWVKKEEIPQYLMDAAVAIEDKRFYKHNGVDWVRTCKGVLNMFTGSEIVGGSTITQQLIKNLTTDDEVTVKRKITEIFRALEFEKEYSKEDILTWYLNYIYLGEQCNGVYTASYAYFGKNVSQLSLAECASLIGITNNPSKYDPYSSLEVVDEETGEVKTAKDFNKERQEAILYAMEEQGYITAQERDDAIAEELNFVSVDVKATQSRAYSWYEDQVINDVIDDLMEEYNLSEEAARMRVFSGGLEIYTCLDPDVQAAVDEVYNDRSNLNYTSSTGQDLQSAITVVDNETGDVVAMAGGVGEKTSSRSWNRAVDTVRPPGSSIKPLAVYGPAIELGLITPSSTEVDSAVEDGWPVNSDGTYRGTVTITQAVTKSINTVAVKVLQQVTPEVSFQFLQERFHITSLVENRTVGNQSYTDIGLAQLALGGLTDGVSTYEMAAAYSAFARQGTYIQPRTYSLVLDSEGETLLSRDNTASTAVSARTSYYITQMLEQVVSSGTGTAANFSGQEIAGKTGTTTSRKDLWFVGYTPYYTAAVWTGYDQQERLDSSLSNPSTTLWRKVMEKVHSSLPYKDFDMPDDGSVKTITYCAVSGKLPTSYCTGHLTTGTFYSGDEPTEYCTVHRPVVSHSSGSSSSSSGGSSTTTTDTSTDTTTTTTDTGGGDTTTTDTPAADTGGGDAAGTE